LKKIKTSPAARSFAKALAAATGEKYFLRLYLAGASARSREALRRVHQQCEAEMKDHYELEVIDVYQQPNLARDNQIVATPTLIRVFPRPARRFIGNLTHASRLFGELDLTLIKGKIAL
jgi:circadian clock protein KaiB